MPSAVYLHDGEHQITVTFRKEEDKERFKAHYRALDALGVQYRDELVAERERTRVLREALAGVVGDEPPISDLTSGYPWAGCSYCYGPHYHSAYHKRMGTYRGEYGQEPPPEPGEDEYAPFTEHTADCPWAGARAALATAGEEGATP